MRVKSSISLFFSMLLSMTCSAQLTNPIKFSVKQKTVSSGVVEVSFHGSIASGWHVYSVNLPSGGPTSATITNEKTEGAVATGKLMTSGNEINVFDDMFGMKVRYFTGSVTFKQRYKITASSYHIKGYLEYGACNDKSCLPPTEVDFDFTGKGSVADAHAVETVAKDRKADVAVEDTATLSKDNAVKSGMIGTDSVKSDSIQTAGASLDKGKLWQPVIKELQSFGGEGQSQNRSWAYILLMGFLGGLIALFTPCVWPIIPMTVSFFLKRSGDRRRGIRDAITYGISIIVIYLALGLAITGIFGASSLNSLATNAVFNIFFCLLLVVFALSFFGWFEMTLPSSWSNSVDSKASQASGLLSIFLMAFTLTLVSFSCTGPIIGFLLVEVSTSGSIVAPAIGMFGFALALALPFTLFALFPTWLKQAPKSGSWMNIIKVTLGFIELAFALKFLSVADLAYGWHLMDREVFLSLWIVIFGLLGLYLIGKIHFKSDGKRDDRMPVPCFILGMLSLAFTVYMIPGLWGAPCKAISAFAPPMSTQDFNLYHNEVRAAYTDYEEGMAAAKAQSKPVLVDFTGYGCVNCRKMEAAVWTDAKVADFLKNDFVLISLYVDDKKALPEPIQIIENGQQRTLRTVGDKWSYLQRSKFGANAQPFYVILDNEGMPLNHSYSFDDNVKHYMEFLESGLSQYRK
jgi:thiol:disulfide interchange protein